MSQSSEKTKKYAEITILFRAGLAGDAPSYNRFLHAITPLLRRFIHRKIPPSHTEDVLQETLISIHKARHTYDGERPILPWLFAITQFRINDALRKTYNESKRDYVDVNDLADQLQDVTEAPHNNEYIEEILKDVSEREKRILTMMHVEGYTAQEIGDRLGMKLSAVKVAAHRAIKNIRNLLRDEDGKLK